MLLRYGPCAPEAVKADAYGPPAWQAARRDAATERLLFEAILAGDDGVAAEIADRLLPVVEGALGRVLGRHEPRGDLLDRCLHHTIGEIARGPCPWVCSLETWAKASSAQVGLESLRSLRAGGALDADAAGALMTEASRNAARRRACPSRFDLLRGHLAELPHRQADVLVLHDLLGLTLTEVAITLGIPSEKVTSLLARGRAQLSARTAKHSAPGRWVAAAPAVNR